MDYRMRIGLSLTLLFILSNLATGQTPAPQQAPSPEKEPPRFRVTSDAVRLDVFVTDKRGNPVPGLTAEDFEVLRNGQPQEILTCSYVLTPEARSAPKVEPGKSEVGTPPGTFALPVSGVDKRWISIVVNDPAMSFVDIARVRIQLQKFVERQVGPNDMVSIMQVSGGSGVLLPFTSDKKVLAFLVDKIRFQLRGFGSCYG